ncbi:MAG: hypothetical protein KJ831_04280, partial [Candidatus Eisenbacteria bacterium]|nr:hypothetical protein [Candidatus Eisenbacteria bacterium]
MRRVGKGGILIESLVSSFLILGCGDNGTGSEAPETTTYRTEMRNFVEKISAESKRIDVSFEIIPQNGHELLTENGGADGAISAVYLASINGIGREDLFYGYNADNTATPG